MASASYSFIDIAAMDAVRTRFAAGDALAILSLELERVLWANGPGASLLGHADIEAAIGAAPRFDAAVRRQIMSSPGFPEAVAHRTVAVRMAGGLVNLQTGTVLLPGGGKGLLLAVPASGNRAVDTRVVAERAVSGFSEAGHFAALVAADGSVAAASSGFGDLGIAGDTLRGLVAEVRGEDDRLVKRIVAGAPRRFPAGMARLTDDPAMHLLVVVDEGEAAEPIETPAAEAPDDEEPDAVPVQGGDDTEPQARREESLAPAVTAQTRTARLETTAADPAGGHEEARRATARFAWRIDADARFTTISPEFGDVVGEAAADVIGRPFAAVSETFGLDPSGEIAALIERRDTWSGRTVMWPVAGTALKVPVDLAALPTYDRDRVFEGFRGFGIVRGGEAVADSEAIGMRLVAGGEALPAAGEDAPADPVHPEPAHGTGREDEATEAPDEPEHEDPFRGEMPALAVAPPTGRRAGDKVVSLAEHRPDTREGGLSLSEQTAFREIGERLRGAGDSSGDEQDEGSREDPKAEAPAAGADGIAQDDSAEGAAEDEPGEGGSEAPAAPDEASPKPPANVAFLPSAFSGARHERAGTRTDTSVFAHLPVPVLIHSGDVLRYANSDFLELTGHSSLAALEAAGGLGAIFADPYDNELDGVEAGRMLRLRTASGDEFPVEGYLQSVPWDDGKALLLALGHPGAQEEAEQADADADADAQAPSAADEKAELEIRLDEMRTIIDTATDGVVIIDNDGTIRAISRPAEALFGFEAEETTGWPFASLFAIESQRAAQDYLSGLSDNGVASVLNDGREVIGREARGRFIPMFMTIGRLPNESGFCAVLRDITQWKRAEEELTQARSQAESASSQKSEFLARVSHEIRTPLNAIIGFSELMIDEKFGPLGSERYRDYLRDINRSGNHVLDLVNDLLDISKIEAGQQEMHYEAVSLNEALGETVAMMQPQANRERVIIRSSFASRVPEVVADLRSVRQIALNLLSNAVRYTTAGGQVIVSTAYETDGSVVIRVRDTGVGMSTAEIDEALKPFRQISTLKRKRGEGTGLGLPLTRAMVEANRARFAISSTPGRGTLVEVAFPPTRVLAD